MTMSTSTSTPLLSIEQALAHPYLSALAASLLGLIILSLIYHDRPIGASRSTLPQVKPSYPLMGSTPTLLRVASRELRMLDTMLDFQRRFGAGGQPYTFAFYGLGNRTTVLNNPAYVQWVQKTNFENYPKGPDQMRNMSDVLGTHGIFVADGATWLTQRKLASHIFSVGNFRTHVQNVITADLATLSDLLVDASRTSTPIALPDLMFRFTLSSFSMMAFEAAVGCLPAKVQGLQERNLFADSFDYAQNVMDHRFFSPYPLWTENFTKQGRKMKRSIRNLETYCFDIIDKRLEQRRQNAGADGEEKSGMGDKSGKDLLDLFAEQGLTREELLPVILNFLIAGRDTTAQSLAWFFYELFKQPQHVAPIRAEIERVLGEPASQRKMGFEDHKDMPFLHACFYEAIRLWPAVPKNLKRIAKDDVVRPQPYEGATKKGSAGGRVTFGPRDITLPDVKVTRGETVVWSDWAMARMPEIWGEDCETFDPWRFLEKDPATGDLSVKHYSEYHFHAFNAGPRRCLGQLLATYEGMAVVAEILGKFDVVYDEAALRAEPPTYQDSLTLPCSPYHVRFQARKA